MSLGFKFAGTNDPEAFKTLVAIHDIKFRMCYIKLYTI